MSRFDQPDSDDRWLEQTEESPYVVTHCEVCGEELNARVPTDVEDVLVRCVDCLHAWLLEGVV